MFRERKKITWAKKEKKRNPFVLRIIFDFLLLIFLGSAVYVLFFSPYLRISRLFLDGVEELNYGDVVAEINYNFNGNYLKIIPRSNFILVSGKRLKNDLTDKFKKIENVEIEKKFPDTIILKIKERKALILWCSQGPCYIVDEKGVAYTGADFKSKEIKENNLIRLADVSAQPVEIGEKVLEPDFIQFSLGIKDELKKETNLEIGDEYFTRSSVADEVQVKTSEGWDIYFNSQLPLGQSIETLKIFLDDKMDQENRSKLEYVDLRVENKVYYKFKDEENNPEEENEGQDKTSESKEKENSQ